MTYHQQTRTLGVRCDKPGCDAYLQTPVHLFDAMPYEQRFQRWLHNQGWSVWVGRGQRQYCPVHGPHPKSRMRQVTPRERS